MPTAKQLQQNCLKAPSTKRAYRSHIKKFVGWYQPLSADYEEEGSEPIFKQSTTGGWFINNSQAWCGLMERRADTAEENAPKNPLFEYCTKKITESWEKGESGASACQKLRSCLVGLLKRNPTHGPTELTPAGVTSVQDFFKGISNTTANKNQETGADHAKETVPKFVYAAMCLAFLRKGKIVEWAHLVLQWCFMSRAINVGQIHFNFMDWAGDMLTVLYSHTKTLDDESRKGLKPFHLATNPDEPWMCPVTAIALLLFHGLWHSGGALFSGAAVAKNYATALAEILTDPEVVAALLRAGVSAADVATHSVRKSAASHASGGMGIQVAIFSLLLRGGWSIGNVLKRYIKVAEHQDRLLARLLSGLDPTRETFKNIFFPSWSMIHDDERVLVCANRGQNLHVCFCMGVGNWHPLPMVEFSRILYGGAVITRL